MNNSKFREAINQLAGFVLASWATLVSIVFLCTVTGTLDMLGFLPDALMMKVMMPFFIVALIGPVGYLITLPLIPAAYYGAYKLIKRKL